MVNRDYIGEGLARGIRCNGATTTLVVVVIPHGWIRGILAFKLGRIGGGISVIIGCNDKISGGTRRTLIPKDTVCDLTNWIYINGMCNAVRIGKELKGLIGEFPWRFLSWSIYQLFDAR